jgi:hypothetical protein
MLGPLLVAGVPLGSVGHRISGTFDKATAPPSTGDRAIASVIGDARAAASTGSPLGVRYGLRATVSAT